MPDLKITADHLRRDAYLYIRQSTLRQVAENGESTQRQYALRCPSPDELRQFRAIRKGGSGSSGSEVKLPVVDAASVDFRLCAA